VGGRPATRGTLRPDVPGHPDPGLYGPDSEAWCLNREAFLLLGAGPRALLMQIAHPLVAEGVIQHSDFKADPWARLRGTLRSYLTIVYGTTAAARAEIGRLNAMHRSIGGPVRDAAARRRFGSAYDARDPELSLWVHATLVDSTITAYDAWVEPLPRARRGRFYDETRPIARAFGIPEVLLPADLAAFDAYLEAMQAPDGPVHPTAAARELARWILRPTLEPLAKHAPGWWPELVAPLLAAVPAAAHEWTMWPSVGLLPERLRDDYGLPSGRLERAVSGWLVAAWRGWLPLLPRRFRWMPQALAADRRMTGGEVPGSAS
jgi:uncharacterized protein (DUF2236 family)